MLVYFLMILNFVGITGRLYFPLTSLMFLFPPLTPGGLKRNKESLIFIPLSIILFNLGRTPKPRGTPWVS